MLGLGNKQARAFNVLRVSFECVWKENNTSDSRERVLTATARIELSVARANLWSIGYRNTRRRLFFFYFFMTDLHLLTQTNILPLFASGTTMMGK